MRIPKNCKNGKKVRVKTAYHFNDLTGDEMRAIVREYSHKDGLDSLTVAKYNSDGRYFIDVKIDEDQTHYFLKEKTND